MAELLTRATFDLWLRGHRSNAVVGIANRTGESPVARCLRHLFPSARITFANHIVRNNAGELEGVARGRIVVMVRGRPEFHPMPDWMFDFTLLSDREAGRSPPFVSPLVTLADEKSDLRPITASAARDYLARVA